jgi:hypothetical protein
VKARRFGAVAPRAEARAKPPIRIDGFVSWNFGAPRRVLSASRLQNFPAPMASRRNFRPKCRRADARRLR